MWRHHSPTYIGIVIFRFDMNSTLLNKCRLFLKLKVWLLVEQNLHGHMQWFFEFGYRVVSGSKKIPGYLAGTWVPAAATEKGAQQPPLFGPWLLWPNSWMDQHATWYRGRPRPRPHCARWGPSSPQRGTDPTPNFQPTCIVAKWSPISATAEHL